MEVNQYEALECDKEYLKSINFFTKGLVVLCPPEEFSLRNSTSSRD